MNTNDLYLDTIAKLKRDIRPLILLTPELILRLKLEWQNALNASNIDQSSLKKILCILDNTQNMTSELNELFIKTLEQSHDPDLLIYTLAASQKHVIGESLRTGNMISNAYFQKLKELLKSKNPEVLEWTLRTIEAMGPLSLRFIKDVRDIKPGVLKFFNPHLKSSSQLITLMEKQWEKMRL